MTLVAGSKRASVPFASVISQMLPAPATTDPSELPIVVLIVAVIALVLVSTRTIVLSRQFGTHTLPNATARPEQGRLPVVIVAATVFVFGSNRAMVSFGAFDTHTASSTAIQSGFPSYGNTASGLSRSIGIFTPGVLTPGLGGRAVCRAKACTAQDPSSKAMTIRGISTVHNNPS